MKVVYVRYKSSRLNVNALVCPNLGTKGAPKLCASEQGMEEHPFYPGAPKPNLNTITKDFVYTE